MTTIELLELALGAQFQYAISAGVSYQERDQAVDEARASVKKLEADLVSALTKLEMAKRLLRFADRELTYVVPEPAEDSEYDLCKICGEPEWKHKPDCKGRAWDKEVQDFLKDE